VPMTTLAEKVAGQRLAANIVGLGALAALTQIVSRESLEEAIRARAPKGTTKMNLKALAAGYEVAEQIKEDIQ
jgi:2-oxoglutarate ferredoxin oxidoreductase subunit gamma